MSSRSISRGKVAIVTGANTGIGQGIAVALAEPARTSPPSAARRRAKPKRR